jgi:hypothetical protein
MPAVVLMFTVTVGHLELGEGIELKFNPLGKI